MNEVIKHKIKHNISRFVTSTKWVIFSIIVGIIVGICATAFFFGLSVVTDFRIKYPWLLFFLPLGGMAIVGLYHLLKDDNDSGTNLVISAIHSGDHLPFKMAPLIFVSHTFLAVQPVVKEQPSRWVEASATRSENFSNLMKRTSM